jgi:hypothetical protein
MSGPSSPFVARPGAACPTAPTTASPRRGRRAGRTRRKRAALPCAREWLAQGRRRPHLRRQSRPRAPLAGASALP